MTSWLGVRRDVESEIRSKIQIRSETPTTRLNKIKLWLISAPAGLATIVACDLLARRHMATLDSLQVLNRGSIDGLDQRFRRKLLSVSDLSIGAKKEQKWTVKQIVKPKSQVCFVTGSLDFSNYSSWFEIEVDDYWWFSEALVQSDEKLRNSLLEEGAVKVQGRWRSKATARLLFHHSKDGRRIKFTVPLESDRDVLEEFRISTYNGAERNLTLGAEAMLVCSAEVGANEAQILKETQAVKFNPQDIEAGDPNALNDLQENVQSLQKSEWPFAVAELFLEERSPEATLAATSDLEERCEAEFYIGEFEEAQDHKSEAIEAMQAATACPIKLIARHTAEAELQRLTSQ